MPSPINDTPFRNEILAALSIQDVEAIRPHLHLVTLTSNQVLYEPDIVEPIGIDKDGHEVNLVGVTRSAIRTTKLIAAGRPDPLGFWSVWTLRQRPEP